MFTPRKKFFGGFWSHIATVFKKLFLKTHLLVKVSKKSVAIWLQMPRKNFLRGVNNYPNTFHIVQDTGFVAKDIACSYDAYWSIYSRKATKSCIFTDSMSKIQLDFGRISKTSFFPNCQSLSPSRKKLVRHIKKRKVVQGVTIRWSIQNRKN